MIVYKMYNQILPHPYNLQMTKCTYYVHDAGQVYTGTLLAIMSIIYYYKLNNMFSENWIFNICVECFKL